MRVLILGVNGFIGSHLSERILRDTDWEVFGLDIESNKLAGLLDHPRFHFVEGDITISRDWIEYHIKRSDVVLPLVAIATPATYVKHPLRVFELDFEANLQVIRQAVKYGTRVVFPSTSEVYGMCADDRFDEDNSNFVLGPINKQRWIYSCCKQLMDRVLWAYGFERGFNFSIFRPYNWIGPKLDDIHSTKDGSSRVVTQFIANILQDRPIHLVNGGRQSRCFLYIDDGIDCLMRIIANKGRVCDRTIFNIGNDRNCATIRELAQRVKRIFAAHPLARSRGLARRIRIEEVSADKYYGPGYQDVSFRIPSIKKARTLLGWKPRTDLDTALRKTIDYYIRETLEGARHGS